ncbi:hypothetical protein AAC387_Pa12g0345 [Persea americana]|eukprot:TRINITY_DN24308_c1_g3_i1.p1 TRINITY_DN24308_c1_g3~~TRINITY_DN24308_c1_g3_i1.p1  ORF type:complete len:123 (+),score=26.92 TRINITY_DN24308_c1_g3_i1:266-634(+)
MDRKGASSFPSMSLEWRKLWGRHVRKKNAAHFRREAIVSVVETAKSITKTSIVGSSQDSLTGVDMEQDFIGVQHLLSNSAVRQQSKRILADQVVKESSPIEEEKLTYDVRKELWVTFGTNES